MKIFILKNTIYLLINLIFASFFCVSLVNFFSNEHQYNPFVKTNILKNYLQYIGIYKSIERY
ncbi:peptide ABC transporter permease, partial [Borreliella bissettiae]